MRHESFENPDIARLMNERFINIKVDRQERPDLDDIYDHLGGGFALPHRHCPRSTGTFCTPGRTRRVRPAQTIACDRWLSGKRRVD